MNIKPHPSIDAPTRERLERQGLDVIVDGNRLRCEPRQISAEGLERIRDELAAMAVLVAMRGRK